LQDLLYFIQVKIEERHRNITGAFRFFDYKGKGKIKKSHLITGLDKLRVRLSSDDID
jgi:Ca2+-binding EF-hand superfamily protein